MKKFLLSLVALSVLVVVSSFVVKENYQEYVGVYKIKDGPLNTVTVTTENSKLFAEVDSYGKNEIIKQDKEDVFKSVSSYGTVYTFQRNADKKITAVKLALMEQELVAEKEK
ncbi:MAG: DUF3471 domain-containing protein [Spirosomataceae bacterium]